ncbi:MAG: MraY family glycosyltransferase [Culicoidibacterales bacterium]
MIQGLSIIDYLLFFGVSAIISFAFMPQIYSLAKNVRAIDDPSVSERKIHLTKIPRLGGLAIYISFLLGYTIVTGFTEVRLSGMESILIGSFLIVLMGIFDDISPVKAWRKFLIQILAAVIVVYRGDFVVSNIDFIVNIQFNPYFAQIFTVLWIVTITNAINLSDGMDGLAAGISFISLITMAIIAVIDNGSYSAVVVLITLLLAGSIIGFLPYNFPPAKIFMGDSGAQFIGFMIGTVSVLGYKQAAFTSFLVPVVILAVPLFDTVFAFLRRIINKSAPQVADASHVHHRVLESTKSQKKTLFYIYGLSILFSMSAVSYTSPDNKIISVVLLVISVIAAEFFIEYFHIISLRYYPIMYIINKIIPGLNGDNSRRKRVLSTLRMQKKSGVNKKK